MDHVTRFCESRITWQHIGATLHLGNILERGAISLLACVTLLPASALALPNFTLAPQSAKFYGDGTSTIVACVKDGNVGVSGVSFQVFADWYGAFPWSHAITVGGTDISQNVINVGNTDSSGCYNIAVKSRGLPETSFNAGYYALVVVSANTPTNYPGGLSIQTFVNNFAYTVSSLPTPVSSDGTYAVSVKLSAAGSNDFSSLPITGQCPTGLPSAISMVSPKSVSTGNIATFTMNVSNSLITDRNVVGENISKTCTFYFWAGDQTKGSLAATGYNTCGMALSPGDPNCGGP